MSNKTFKDFRIFLEQQDIKELNSILFQLQVDEVIAIYDYLNTVGINDKSKRKVVEALSTSSLRSIMVKETNAYKENITKRAATTIEVTKVEQQVVGTPSNDAPAKENITDTTTIDAENKTEVLKTESEDPENVEEEVMKEESEVEDADDNLGTESLDNDNNTEAESEKANEF